MIFYLVDMFAKFPKDTADINWTSHVKRKMAFYGLSEQRVRSVMRNPKRHEDGIAPETVAVMQRNDKPKKNEEIWVMYAESRKHENTKAQKQENQKTRKQTVVISAWRYPGISKKRDGVPVPDDVLRELDKFLANQ